MVRDIHHRNNNSRKASNNVDSRRKLVLGITRPRISESTQKITFKDAEGNDVKEYVAVFKDGDNKACLIELFKQLGEAAELYEYYDEKQKVLSQHMS
jgi:hypothetical protein